MQSLFEPAQIHLHSRHCEQFERLLWIFKRLNRSVNLSGISGDREIIVRHFVDSLLITKCLDLAVIGSAIDVGSGGGFPGLPIAIFCPHIRVTICDSVAKKTQAVAHIATELKLANVRVVTARAETLGRDAEFREKYDLGLARAVAHLPTLLEYLAPFPRLGGTIAAYKGQDFRQELAESQNALAQLGLELKEAFPYQLPENQGDRAMLLFGKRHELDERYPRRPGLPQKRPL